MKILTFTLSKYQGVSWEQYLSDFLGKETAEKCKIESHATAGTHIAKINILNFNESKAIVEKIKKNEDVHSAYIAHNQGSTQIK